MVDQKALQDKLILEMFDLIEQSVKWKRNIETTTNSGQLLLAKSRYIQGGQTVTIAQLPTENSDDFNALSRIERPEENMDLVKHEVDKGNGFVDPLRWFGVLVPRSLHSAQQQFNKAVELVVENAMISNFL